MASDGTKKRIPVCTSQLFLWCSLGVPLGLRSIAVGKFFLATATATPDFYSMPALWPSMNCYFSRFNFSFFCASLSFTFGRAQTVIFVCLVPVALVEECLEVVIDSKIKCIA